MKNLIAILISLTFFGISSYARADGAEDHACAKINASGNSEYPPYLWRSPTNPEKLTGAIAFMVEDIAKELGIEIELNYEGPWGRVQVEVAAGRVDMITGAFFTKPRTEYMDYIYPEFQGTKTAVWVNKDKPFQFSQWEDLKAHQGITVVHNSFGEEFDQYAKEHLNIDEVGSLKQGLAMLSMNRVDYLIYEENPGKAYMKVLNIENLIPLEKEVTHQNLFLTVSKKSACNTESIKEKVALIVSKYNKEKKMDNYLKRALSLWAQQQ